MESTPKFVRCMKNITARNKIETARPQGWITRYHTGQHQENHVVVFWPKPMRKTTQRREREQQRQQTRNKRAPEHPNTTSLLCHIVCTTILLRKLAMISNTHEKNKNKRWTGGLDLTWLDDRNTRTIKEPRQERKWIRGMRALLH